MNDCAFYLKKKTRFHALMRRTVGRRGGLRHIRHSQHYQLSLFLSAHSDKGHRPTRTQGDG